MLITKIAHFVDVQITFQKNVLKGYERKRKKLVRLMFRTIDKQNVRLKNALDVDLKIA